MNIKKIITSVIAFTMMSVSIISINTNAKGKTYGNAYLTGEIGSESNWSVTSDAVSIDGNAKYEYTWNVKGEIDFLSLNITPPKDAESFNMISYPNLDVTIDEVWIDGEQIEYTTSSNAVDMNYFENGAGTVRIYLKTGTSNLDINDLPSSATVNKNVRVVFTVDGLENSGTSNYIPVEEKNTDETTVTVTSTTIKTTTTKSNTTTTVSSDVSTTVSAIDTSAPTGDNGISIAVSVMTVSGMLFLATKKKK